MTSRIHFICKDQLGITSVDARAGIYDSEAWLLSSEEVDQLTGGDIVFHQTKATPSYFGGTLLRARPVEEERDRDGKSRWVLTVHSRLECKGRNWPDEGQTHGMAWTSGVIPSHRA